MSIFAPGSIVFEQLIENIVKGWLTSQVLWMHSRPILLIVAVVNTRLRRFIFVILGGT